MSCHAVQHLTEVLAVLPPTIKACKSTWLRLESGRAAAPTPRQSHRSYRIPQAAGGPSAPGTDWKGTCGVDQNISNKTFS